MIEYYQEIRLVHVAAVIASGSLFLVRGLALFAGLRQAMAWPVRLLSYTFDVTLLTAALMLMSIVHQYPFVHPWLTVKVLLLLVYIAAGFMAFRGRCPRPARVGLWLAALGVYVFIYSVARAHDPLGFFSSMART